MNRFVRCGYFTMTLRLNRPASLLMVRIYTPGCSEDVESMASEEADSVWPASTPDMSWSVRLMWVAPATDTETLP